MPPESIPAYATFRGSAGGGHAYNEAAFHYFLAADQSRAHRFQRSMMLVLASLRSSPGHSEHLTNAVASMMFGALAGGVREVDFVGWYRQDRVAGAVLPQGGRSSSELRALILTRITTSLRNSLPAEAAKRLHVRIVRFGSKENR